MNENGMIRDPLHLAEQSDRASAPAPAGIVPCFGFVTITIHVVPEFVSPELAINLGQQHGTRRVGTLGVSSAVAGCHSHPERLENGKGRAYSQIPLVIQPFAHLHRRWVRRLRWLRCVL